MPVQIPKHYKETTISKPNAIGEGIAGSARTATNYITDINNAGITVHPVGGTTSRLQVNANGTTVYQNDTDVAFYGATSRIGKSNGDRVVIDSTDGVTLYMGNSKRLQTSVNGIDVYGSDGSTSIASFGSTTRLGGESAPHIIIDDYGIDMFNRGSTENLQNAVKIDSSFGNDDYVGGRIQFSPSISNKQSTVMGLCTPTSSYISIDATRLISDTWYGPFINMESSSNSSDDNLITLKTSTSSSNYSDLTISPTSFDFMNSDVNVAGGNRALSVSGDAGSIYLRSTASNIGLSDDNGDYLIRKDTLGDVYLNGHNVSYVDEHKFFAAPSGGGGAYFRNIWAADIPNLSVSKVPGIRSGVVGQTNTVTAGSYKDVSVSFGHTYGRNPTVIVGLNSSSTSPHLGSISVAVASVSTTGFTARLFNNSSSDRAPGFYWIAIG